MTVYVESNFILELALGQEESEAAETLLSIAESRRIDLAIPALSVIEPLSTMTQRGRSRQRLRTHFDEHLRQLSRSMPHESDTMTLESFPALIKRIDQREDDRLTTYLRRVLRVATVIELDLAIFDDAIHYRDTFSLSSQDAIIYATILSHLRENLSDFPHVFATRNRKDFADPKMVSDLAARGCTILYRFSDAVDDLQG